MTGSALGGGVIFVVAAVLWAVVLVPAWVRRREFRVSERNAVRLQRTLRVLAETAEVPEEVRVEATARQALTHERLMQSAKKRQHAEHAAQLAQARAEQIQAQTRARRLQRYEAAATRAARLRRPTMQRIRVLAAVVGVLGLLGTLIGAGLLIAGSGSAVIGWSLLAGVIGISTLLGLAPGKATAPSAAGEVRDAQVAEVVESENTEQDQSARALSPAQHAAAQQAAALRIARARALARAREARPGERENQPDSMLLTERTKRADTAHTAASPQRQQTARPSTTSSASSASTPASAQAPTASRVVRSAAPESDAQIAARSQQQAVSARLRKMGVVGDTTEGLPDLDEALRRRRTAG